MRSLVCRYRNLLIREEASRSRISSSCTMNTWRDSGCSSSSSPGATGPGAGSTGYTSCWKLTFGVDGGLSQGSDRKRGPRSSPFLFQPRFLPATPSQSHAWLPPGHLCVAIPRQFKPTWSHRALDLLPGIHLAPLPRPSRLPSHPKRKPSGPRPPVSPSPVLLVLFPQNVSDIPLHFCCLHSCHPVLEAPSPPSSLDGPLACPLPPCPIHLEGSSLAPHAFQSQKGTLAEFSAQQPCEPRTGSVPAHSAGGTATRAISQVSLARSASCTSRPAAPPVFLPRKNLSRI